MTRVNRFRMPFLLSADERRRIPRDRAKRRLAVIPWQMALVSVLLRVMPGLAFRPACVARAAQAEERSVKEIGVRARFPLFAPA